MPKATPLITSFNAGELTHLLEGKVDLKYYPNGCRRIRNFKVTKQGPAKRRAGTRFVAAVKTESQRTWLGSFIYNAAQSYITEYGHQYIRFFAGHGVVGAPFEVTTPYSSADLTTAQNTFKLRFAQSGDVQYICHESYQQRKLTRTGAATFSIAALETYCGPFKPIDPDNTITVYASAATGTGITLTASSAIFLAGHVGSQFLLEQSNTDDVKQWEVGKSISTNDVRRSDGKNYKALNTATTGSVRPTHTVGSKYDGDAGVQWQFLDPGYGWVRITAIGGGGTTATADVISRIPDEAVGSGNASTRWAHGAWSGVEGWPTDAAFYKERLVFVRGPKGWASVSGDFENFQTRDDGGVITADMGFSFDVTSSRASSIEWLAATDQDLLVGTDGAEISIGPIARGEPFGPGNVSVNQQSEYGSRHVPILRVGDGVLFAQISGRKVRDVTYKWETEGYKAIDTTVLAEHVTRGGVVDAAYQQEPDSIAWYVRADGILLGFTIDREQEVRGWHPHRIGGYSDSAQSQYAVVEAISCIPSPDGDRDELWMIVQRYIDGATHRYIEWGEYEFEHNGDQEEAFYVDSGLTLDNSINSTLTPGAGANVAGSTGVSFASSPGAWSSGDVGQQIHYRYSYVNVKGDTIWDKAIVEITDYTSSSGVAGTIIRPFPNLSVVPSGSWRMTVSMVTGIDHLVGQEVAIFADGASRPTQIVPGSGELTLDPPASKVHVGLPCPAVLQPMPVEPNGPDGTSFGKEKRAHQLVISVQDTLALQYGRDEDEQLDQIQTFTSDDTMDFMLPLVSDTLRVAWPDGSDKKLLITIIQPEPFPATIVSMSPWTYHRDD